MQRFSRRQSGALPAVPVCLLLQMPPPDVLELVRLGAGPPRDLALVQEPGADPVRRAHRSPRLAGSSFGGNAAGGDEPAFRLYGPSRTPMVRTGWTVTTSVAPPWPPARPAGPAPPGSGWPGVRRRGRRKLHRIVQRLGGCHSLSCCLVFRLRLWVLTPSGSLTGSKFQVPGSKFAFNLEPGT